MVKPKTGAQNRNMNHADQENVRLHAAPSGNDAVVVQHRTARAGHADGVAVIVTRAYGPGGEPLIDDSGVEFDGFPAISIGVRANGREGVVHLSPFHGDRRKRGFTEIEPGTKCELFCPKSGRPLDRAGPPSSNGEPEYFYLYLSKSCVPSSALYLSDCWGHFDSRIIDNDELISEWLTRCE
jgi:hypothetical protein